MSSDNPSTSASLGEGHTDLDRLRREFMARLRGDHDLNVQQFAAEHDQHAEKILSLFSALLATEQLARHRAPPAGGVSELHALGETMNRTPQVALKSSPDEASGPTERPNSSEMQATVLDQEIAIGSMTNWLAAEWGRS